MTIWIYKENKQNDNITETGYMVQNEREGNTQSGVFSYMERLDA